MTLTHAASPTIGWRPLALYPAITVAYLVAGKLGLSLAFVNASATAVWPCTGIAVACLLLFGTRVWPAIMAGAFLVNVTTTGSIASSLGVAAGNALEAVIAAALTTRFAGGVEAFERARTLLRFVFFAGVVATPVSATIGVTVLSLAGEAEWGRYGAIWLTWWLGDAVGAVVVTPLIVLWARTPNVSWTPLAAIEWLLLFASSLLVPLAVFGGGLGISRGHLPIEFLCIPVGLWAALRFGPREAASTIGIIGIVALWGTVQGQGPFAGGSEHRAIALLQAFIGVAGVMVLMVGTLVAERRSAEAAVRRLNEALEQRVLDRTARLEASNRELVTEIAERRRAQQERERSEARLLEAQRVAHIGSWEWDVVENRIWWSDELFRIFGIAPSPDFDTTYEAYIKRVHPDDAALINAHVQEALATGRPFAFEHRLIAPDGTLKWVSANGQVTRDPEGRIRRIAGTGHDITEWKRLEHERTELVREQAARQQAEEANRLKDEFLATLSHELRTPLNAIVGWLQILNGRTVDPATRQTLGVIERNAASLRRLIEDVLDVSAIVSGKLRLVVQPLDLRVPVRSAFESMRPAAAERGVALDLEEPGEELFVSGDPQRLQQVVTNLGTNAIKFTPQGGRLTLNLVRDDDAAVLRVIDTGIGIHPAVLPHVFEQFRQGDSSVTRRHGGLGLGLAIVRHLVQLHGGSVTADSAGEGLGATFTVRLPLLAASRSDDPPSRDAPVAVVTEGTLTGLRILAVDDDPDTRELLTASLVSAGAVVRTAPSVESALRLIEDAVPDVVLADIAMPAEDGYSLLREMRARGVTVPAIAVTAHASPHERRRAMVAGFAEHVGKPFDLVRLTAIVRALAKP